MSPSNGRRVHGSHLPYFPDCEPDAIWFLGLSRRGLPFVLKHLWCAQVLQSAPHSKAAFALFKAAETHVALLGELKKNQ